MGTFVSLRRRSLRRTAGIYDKLLRGHVSGIRKTITAIDREWFPASGREASGGPMLERYGPEIDPESGMGGVEIWIPLKH